MEHGEAIEQMQQIVTEYDREWRELVIAAVEVELAGPAKAGAAALDLRRSVARYSSSVDARVADYRKRQGHPGTLYDLTAEFDRFRSAREKFVDIGRRALELQ